MSDRRRNAFILLLVAGLLAASAFVVATKDTKLGLDLEGGVSLVYEASPTRFSDVTPESIDRAIDIMRDRVDRLGVAEPEIARQGADQIEVQLPGADDVEQAIDLVGDVAQLNFYDWEKNVLDEDCEPQPDEDSVTGGSAAGQPGQATIPYYGAVIRASHCEPAREQDDTHDGLFYGVEAPQIVEEVFEIVRDLNAKERVTFLLAEQNTNIALRFADHGYILENGRIVLDGPAEDLRANEDVKEFYLGMGGGERRSFREVKSYRRRKRWLS
jgi:preprotein translocase subunit SecD